jgi:putative ABC transport system substrate-binding protein
MAAARRAGAQTSRPPRVVYVGRSPGREAPGFKAFAAGLRERGHVVGDSVIVDVRTPDGDKVEHYPDVAARLVAAGADVIVASNPYAMEATTKATKTIPIVGVDFESDPVDKGWVATLSRPGGNVTGFFLDIPEMSAKQLQLLKEAKPTLGRVAVLGVAQVNAPQFHAVGVAAREMTLALQRLPIKTLDEIPKALAEAGRRRAEALLLLSSPMVFGGMPRIAEAAVKHRLPTISLFVPFFAEAGGLLAYGPAFLDAFRRAAGYVDRILKGAQPGDLPVQRPTKFEFAVNRRTAAAIGLTIPSSLLLRADYVIE